MQINESWFSNTLLPLLFDYREAGAKNLSDYIKRAQKDRENDIVEYLLDISNNEWKKVQGYLDAMEESENKQEANAISVTKGMANAMSKMSTKLVCPECGVKVPKYTGAYPKKCAQCGATFVSPEDDGTEEDYIKLGEIILEELQSERLDIDFLGVLGNTLYVTVNGRKYGYRKKSGKISKLAQKVKDVIYTNPQSALDLLNKEALLVSEDISKVELKTVEDRITYNRLQEFEKTLKDYDPIQSFWVSKKGKALAKEIKSEKEENDPVSKGDKEGIVSAYNMSILNVNNSGLLDFLKDARVDKETGATMLLIDNEAPENNIESLLQTLTAMYQGTQLVNEKKKDEDDYLIAVY